MGSKKIFSRFISMICIFAGIKLVCAVIAVIMMNADMIGTEVLVVAITAIDIIALSVLAIRLAGSVEADFKNMVIKIKASTKVIDGNAVQLREASENLANGSSRQAAAIEQTSATMNETTSKVTQNAENTRIAAQITTESLNIVGQAGEHMMKMMDTMAELKESSDKVGKIIKTIDEIAFQTNLLAINATVEAARAGGEAGKSFAVVAQEVRNLAGKSAKAVTDTAAIIEKNVNLTDTSKEEAESVLVLSQQNGEQIQELHQLITEINMASEQQAIGIKEINMAISEMEKVTQENAAVAQENAASSNSMKDEIANLDAVVAHAANVVRDMGGIVPAVKSAPKPVSVKPTTSYKPATSSSTVKKAVTPVYKPEPAVQTPRPATTIKKSSSDAEKVIPLDDDDDF